jgi:hypothetical protein
MTGQMVYTDRMSNIIVKGVPDKLWREFKSKCALQGVTAKDKIIELIRREVEKK